MSAQYASSGSPQRFSPRQRASREPGHLSYRTASATSFSIILKHILYERRYVPSGY